MKQPKKVGSRIPVRFTTNAGFHWVSPLNSFVMAQLNRSTLPPATSKCLLTSLNPKAIMFNPDLMICVGLMMLNEIKRLRNLTSPRRWTPSFGIPSCSEPVGAFDQSSESPSGCQEDWGQSPQAHHGRLRRAARRMDRCRAPHLSEQSRAQLRTSKTDDGLEAGPPRLMV